MHPFHLAFPVHDLSAARSFYGEMLGCPEGRSSDEWVDFNLLGHQSGAHLSPAECETEARRNAVDGDDVPVRHFGLVLSMEEWHKLADRVAGHLAKQGQEFIIPPHVRFKGEVGEQATFFLRDPSGNALEFKAFADPSRLFAK
jgi:extradiol dioxygenase family protein